MDASSRKELRAVLEKLYHKYNRRELIWPDPLQFVYHYESSADMELAGFFASALAYGRVAQIEKSLNNLFGRMEHGPREFVEGFSRRSRKELEGFKHRFNTADDIGDICELLSWVIGKYGSLERYFCEFYNCSDVDSADALAGFCDSLIERYRRVKRRPLSRGLNYLLSSPSRGSASKRLHLFLRWMVRDDDVDTGIWKSVDAAKLLVPVDVHIARLSGILGLHNRRTINISAVREITAGFGLIEPSDPVKYDFALSRIGIVEDCTGAYREQCEVCELFGYCRKRAGFG